MVGCEVSSWRFARVGVTRMVGVGGMIRVRRLGGFRLASLRRDGRGARRHMVHYMVHCMVRYMGHLGMRPPEGWGGRLGSPLLDGRMRPSLHELCLYLMYLHQFFCVTFVCG